MRSTVGRPLISTLHLSPTCSTGVVDTGCCHALFRLNHSLPSVHNNHKRTRLLTRTDSASDEHDTNVSCVFPTESGQRSHYTPSSSSC